MSDTPHVTTIVRAFDAAELADIYARNAAPGSFAFRAPDAGMLQQMQDSDGAQVILAEYSHTIIGAALMTFPATPEETRVVPWFSREDLAVLSRIVVEGEMQRLGVASQILACAERTALHIGATGIGCPVLGSSGDFLAPLERRGYRPAAKFAHEGDKLIVMHKPVSAESADAA